MSPQFFSIYSRAWNLYNLPRFWIPRTLSHSSNSLLFIMMRFLQNLHSAISSNEKWRQGLLDNQMAYLLRDPEISHLQSNLHSFRDLFTFKAAVTRLATTFQKSDENPINYLRSCLQVLVLYSIHTSDINWVSRKEAIGLEKSAKELEKLLLQHSTQPPACVSLDTYAHLANFLERQAKIQLLRVSIMKMLSALVASIQTSIIFRTYNPENEQHIKNAAAFLRKISPRSHYLTGTAFSLVMHPFLSSEVSSTVFSFYSDHDDEK